MTELRKVREEAVITQKQAAELLGVSLRSYITYENDPGKEGSLKYRYMLGRLQEIYRLDEEHGLLDVERIRETVTAVCARYPVDYGVLFGSYAKGNASESSDVDLILATDLTGLEFFEMVEELRENLHKKVDVLNTKQIVQNEELICSVLRDGIRLFRCGE